MENLEKINNKIIKFLTFVLIILGTILTITVFVNVCSRYFFHSTIPWSEELARFVFVWVTFVGLVVANDKQEHMRLDFLVNALPNIPKKIIEILAYTISIVFLLLLVHGGVTYTISQWDWMSSALGIRHGLIYSIAPISLFYMVIQFLTRMIKTIMSFSKKKEVE